MEPGDVRGQAVVVGRDHSVDRDRALANAGSLLDDAQVLWHVGGHGAEVRHYIGLVFGEIGRAWLSHRRYCGLSEEAVSRRDQEANLLAAWAFLSSKAVYPMQESTDDEQLGELLRVAGTAVRASRGMRGSAPA